MKIEAGKIKSWVERIERLLAERAGINGDIKDIYTEIKSGDHDAKAIRKLIQRRAMDPADLVLQDDLLTAYTDAIDGKIRALDAISKGASTKEAAKAGGISTGAVSGLAGVQKSRNVNHDPTTGEITPPSSGGEGEELGVPSGRDAPSDEHPKPRSPAFTTSDSTEPVEPAGNEGLAGERGTEGLCGCEKCVDVRINDMVEACDPLPLVVRGPGLPGWRYACETCGNKRCPHHTDHRLACTGSNEPGQPGSSYPAWPNPTPPLGAVAEAQPQRVASTNSADVEIEGLNAETARKFNKIGPPVVTSTADDGGPIPSRLDRRPESRRAGT